MTSFNSPWLKFASFLELGKSPRVIGLWEQNLSCASKAHALQGLALARLWSNHPWASQVFVLIVPEAQFHQLKATKHPGKRDPFRVVICRILWTKQVANILDHNVSKLGLGDLEWLYWKRWSPKPLVFLARSSSFSKNLVERAFLIFLPSNHQKCLHTSHSTIS